MNAISGAGAVNTTNALADALKLPAAAASKENKTVVIDGKAQTVKVEAAATVTEVKATPKAKAKKAEIKKETKPAATTGETKKDAGKKETKIAVKKEEVKAKEKKVNPKLEKARKIFDKNVDKDAGEIAGLIAKGLEITYSNAYYYVTRVFNKKSSKAS